MNVGIWSLSRQIIFKLEKSELIEANVKNQLIQLKTQINPHFYMNVLNSIHGLIDFNPDKAKEMVIDMSRLMQYMLYDSACDFVSLSKEIKFLKDYIKIIKERYPAGKVEIVTKFPSQNISESIMVPPALFITFVENAFKHGVDYRYESEIIINMDIVGNKVHFLCMNHVHPLRDNIIRKGGIGLENTKKRLELIFNGKAELEIKKTDIDFIVNLTIPYENKNSCN